MESFLALLSLFFLMLPYPIPQKMLSVLPFELLLESDYLSHYTTPTIVRATIHYLFRQLHFVTWPHLAARGVGKCSPFSEQPCAQFFCSCCSLGLEHSPPQIAASPAASLPLGICPNTTSSEQLSLTPTFNLFLPTST